MTKPPSTQSQKRFQDSLASLFTAKPASGRPFVFLKSSSDIGVQRNGGRNGARFAPQSFLSYFKKLNITSAIEEYAFTEIEVASEQEEKADFNLAQQNEAQRIQKALGDFPSAFFCHLGGGHDHVYPLLKALGEKYKKIIVINIDAHADTRTDPEFHSGTPFRQFAAEYKGKFELFQLGLLPFANSTSTLGPLQSGPQQILWREELKDEKKRETFFQTVATKIGPDCAVIFSLDADALAGNEVPGVSAVNGHGISREELSQLWSEYRKLPLQHAPLVGIYELNPVYDTLSMLSMRTLGTFLFECL